MIRIHLIVLFVLLLAACGNAPGDEASMDERVTAVSFIDLNVNGRLDPNEPPIPETLMVSQHNVHGSFTRTGALTDADGRADFSATYTHFFDIAVVPPCGYEATTAVTLSAKDADSEGVVAFGFRPEDSELDMAALQVQIWQDDYADGALGEGERPLADTTIQFDPDLAWIDSADIMTGTLTAQTNTEGKATVSLGNGCAVVWVTPLVPQSFTKIRPAAIYEDGKVGFAYAAGLLDVRMGFANAQATAEPAFITPHQFTFASGSPHHPEGFGEWQFLLDSGGYFTLKHIVQDEETDYGVITLLPAENEQLWQLIDAANLSSLPASTSEVVPDTVSYTFTLTSADGDAEITLWATEAQAYEDVMALLDGVAAVVKSHTGEEAVLR